MYRFSQNSRDKSSGGPADGVFVNRLLDFRQISAVGLDLDHTLAIYNDQAFNALAFEESIELLISSGGYPPSINSGVYDNSLVIRGLYTDTDNGALLKFDDGGLVLSARSTEGWLRPEAIRSYYNGNRVDPRAGRYHGINTPFDLPVAILFHSVLSAITPADRRKSAFVRVLWDVRRTLDQAHTKGRLKSRILGNPGAFVRNQPGTAGVMGGLKAAGKRLFLLTNSDYNYAQKVLDHILPDGPDGSWKELFDAVVVDAGKPGFFSGDTDLEPVGSGDLPVFRGGSAVSLERRLDFHRQGVLYIGDNPSGDCSAGLNHGWAVAMVVPEIEYERASPVCETAESRASSHRWGSVFRENGHLTWFGGFLANEPQLYAAGARQILEYCLDGFQVVSQPG